MPPGATHPPLVDAIPDDVRVGGRLPAQPHGASGGGGGNCGGQEQGDESAGRVPPSRAGYRHRLGPDPSGVQLILSATHASPKRISQESERPFESRATRAPASAVSVTVSGS